MASMSCAAFGSRVGSDLRIARIVRSELGVCAPAGATTKSPGFRRAHAESAASAAASGHSPRVMRVKVAAGTPVSRLTARHVLRRAAATAASTS